MILIIGATGTVGRELVKLLATRGIPLRVLARDPARAKAIVLPGVEIAVGDLATPETLAPAFTGIAKLFLLTPSSPKQVMLEFKAIEKAKQAGVKHVVKISTLGAKEDSPISMCRWHRQAEIMVEKSGIEHTFLRPQHYMQNFLAFAPIIRAEGILRAPMETGRMGLVDARDVALVAAEMLTQPHPNERILRITGGEQLSFQNLAEHLSRAVGKSIVYKDIGEDVCRAELKNSGFEDWLIEDQIQIYRMFNGLLTPLVNDTVERVTGKKPRSFLQFALDYAPVFS